MDIWHRNDYLNYAHERGRTGDVAKEALSQAQSMQRNGFPAILTLRHLADIHGVAYQYLRTIVSRTRDPYRVFRLRKQGGGFRTITVPENTLIGVHRWIDRQILQNVQPDANAVAYCSGSSVMQCAKKHAGCRWLIKCDVQQFFESISELQVYRVFQKIGYSRLVSFELSRLTTRIHQGDNARYDLKRWQNRRAMQDNVISAYTDLRVGHLPQGAPTSPRLSNLAVRPLDEGLGRIAIEYRLSYSRYADDIFFSSHHSKFNRENAVAALQRIRSVIRKHGLRPHATKCRIVPPGARKVVLGLCVNDERPRLSKEFRQQLELHVYYTCRFGIRKHAEQREFDSVFGFREHLKGLLSFAAQIDPPYSLRLKAELDSKSDWNNLV